MLLPFDKQIVEYLLLVFGIDHVDHDFFRLQESIYPVDCLYEIVEVVVDSREYRPVTMPLEVAPVAGQALFRSEQPHITI
ncbi:hypothetical protein SDC9_170278 [bioreactor metagenome]|uniref:Uncharacterized protein n=1 Tax=bioreactor metagenome TaxID=1076179 RepID=A0A645GGN4_9ZZZZ